MEIVVISTNYFLTLNCLAYKSKISAYYQYPNNVKTKCVLFNLK